MLCLPRLQFAKQRRIATLCALLRLCRKPPERAERGTRGLYGLPALRGSDIRLLLRLLFLLRLLQIA